MKVMENESQLSLLGPIKSEGFKFNPQRRFMRAETELPSSKAFIKTFWRTVASTEKFRKESRVLLQPISLHQSIESENLVQI